MTCCELTELLLDYLNGELTPEQDADLQRHLDDCPPCIHLVSTYQLTIHITRKLPPAAISPECAARLQAKLRAICDDQGERTA